MYAHGDQAHTSSRVHVHTHTGTYVHTHTPETKSSLFNSDATCAPARKSRIWLPGNHDPAQYCTDSSAPETCKSPRVRGAQTGAGKRHLTSLPDPSVGFSMAYRGPVQALTPPPPSPPTEAELWAHATSVAQKALILPRLVCLAGPVPWMKNRPKKGAACP